MFRADTGLVPWLLQGTTPMIVALSALILLVAAVAAKLLNTFPDRRSGRVIHRRKPLLSAWEDAAFILLERQHAPGQRLCPQVAVNALIAVEAETRSAKTAWSNKIARLCVDFVVLDLATTSAILVIELDDRTHERSDRRRRDAHLDLALAGAGIPLKRFKPGQPIEIRRCLQNQASPNVEGRAETWPGRAAVA